MSLQTNNGRIAVLSIDVDKPATDLIGLDGYDLALLIMRLREVVVGQALCPIRRGRISGEELGPYLRNAARPAWNVLVSPQARNPLPSATVAVCTRDRTDDLAECILSLLPLADQGYEVLIVDNCPSDRSTHEVVSRYPQLRYVHEPEPGLDVARNRALMEAQGEIVAFTDDDARVEAGWLAALLQNFDDPMVAVVTGMALPLELETEAQCWFEATNGFGRGFVRMVFQADTMLPLAAGIVGAGVNMAIRRSALAEIGLFDPALDGGTKALSGGDQEFFYRALIRGFRIVYEPKAVVHHRHRREWAALRKTMYGYGVGVFAWWTRALLKERETTLLWRGPRWLLDYHVRNLARSLLRRPGHQPLDLSWTEFLGALAGPFNYIRAERATRNGGRGSQKSSPTGGPETVAYGRG